MHAIALVFRVSVIGGSLRDEVGGTTDRAAWLTRAELGTAPVVALLRNAVAIAFGDEA